MSLVVQKNEPINTTNQTFIQQDSNTKSDTVDLRLFPSKTAKISPAVLLKLNTLKPFIKNLEDMDKASINKIIDILLESYVNTKLNFRQSEGYKSMYKHLVEMLDVNKQK